MKCCSLISTVLIVGCILVLQSGCQERIQVAEESKAGLTLTKPAMTPAKTPIAKPDADEKAPKITFEKMIHDFGEVGSKTKHVCEFKFTNTGEGLLKIDRIKPSCIGCTVAELTKKEYAPGESGTLRVKYSSSSRRGVERKYVYVYSNDKARPKVKLSIKATIVPKVAHEPKELKLLLNKENAGCPPITLRSLDDKPFAIKQFESTGGCITADYDPSVKKAKFVLKAKVDIEKLKKDLNGHIKVSLTHPECDKVTIPFKTLPRFAFKPAFISILDSQTQKPVAREVWVLNNYNEDFEVESASSEKGIVKVVSQGKIDGRYKLQLEITPPVADDKTKFFMDVLSVNMKGGEVLKLPCTGFYSTKQKSSPD